MFSRLLVILSISALVFTGCERFQLETTFNGKVGDKDFVPKASSAEVLGNDMTLTAQDLEKLLILKTNKFQAAYYSLDTLKYEGITSVVYRPIATNEVNQYIGYSGFIHIEYIGGGLVTGDYDVWARNKAKDSLHLVGNFIHVPVDRN